MILYSVLGHDHGLGIESISNPRRRGKGKRDVWSPKKPRWVFMEHDIAYITGLRWARDTLSLFMLP